MSGIAEDRKQKIQEQLDRIVSSTAFSGSERHRQFLRFVVEQALKGDTDKLNEFVLGFEVFNKSESFDPRIDSIVRVEARRLRERLKKYYQEEGRNDPVIITLRPRSFVPEFQEPSAEKAFSGAGWRARFSSHKTAAIALAAVLFGAAVATTVLSFRWRRPSPPQTASILVLPFQTLSPASGQELLGDAIADAIITGLAGSPGLRVISRGSGIQVQESGRSPFQFAADLQVDYVVEGTVQTDAVGARVSAKMTDVHSQSYVWAATRETKLDALGDLERELTSAISSQIRIPLPPESGERVVRRRAANWQSYAAFLKGQYYWYQQDRGSTEKSIALFEEATRGDPNYAPAWAWLSQGYQLMIMRADGRDAAMIAKGRQAAQKALALDNDLAEAHAAVGTYAALDWDWSSAEREFRRAIELNPEWAQGHLLYSLMYLVPTGQMRAAVGEMLRAHELDPLTRTTRTMLAEVMYFNREYARAIAETEDLRKPVSAPSPDDRRYFLSLSLSGQGRRALTEMSQATSATGGHSPAVALLGYLLARNGDRQQATAIQQRLLKKSTTEYVSPLSVALVSVGLGDNDEAFRQLRLAVANHVPAVCQVAADPVFDPLRSDPRYAEIVRGIGLKSNR
jgi:TolB-like protein